ncbi:MAG: pyridoxal-phosphate dependent enzyme [Acidobacteria bacterium]|nr:pyridoxal-phosphate dependent enzyme [Acidobacteriota bacterium]
MSAFAGAQERLNAIPSLDLWAPPSPVHELPRLRDALGGGPRLLIKRDDAIPFGFGGNKVRKVAIVAAHAIAEGADTLLSVGGVQSNSARVVAAVAARMGLHCVLVANGAPPERLAANALLDSLLGAEVHYVPSRDDRAPAMARIAADLRRQGRRPFEIPLGASTSLGALGFVRAVGEIVNQAIIPDVIVHSTSSGGTQAGLVAGCAIYDLPTRVLGISADDPAASIRGTVEAVISGMSAWLDVDGDALAAARPIEIDDTYVGGGYGIMSPASREAADLLARREAIFVDHTYTAKALAGLLGHLRRGSFSPTQTVLFWHTGGQVGLFA